MCNFILCFRLSLLSLRFLTFVDFADGQCTAIMMGTRREQNLMKPFKRSVESFSMTEKFPGETCVTESFRMGRASRAGCQFLMNFPRKQTNFPEFSANYRGGDKHIDSSGSDSELDMPGMMGGPNNQSTSKGSHNNMSANLQHNLLLQQGLSNSQLGNKAKLTATGTDD